MPKEDLNAVSSQYKPNAVTIIENDLILHWYPKRILSRFNHANSLLELGLGHGFTAELFSKATHHHVIVDGSSNVIDQFKKNNPSFSGELVLDYFETFTPKNSFDVIIMGFVLEHVDDPVLILKRYKKFLKPKGKLYVAVPNGKSMNRRMGLALGLIDDIYSLNEHDLLMGHKRQYCLETLRKDLRTSGYSVSHEEGIYLKPLPLDTLKTLSNFKENLKAMCEVGIDFPDLCVGILLEALPD
jgi:ubiquinone/menaquinone biosynthesis C-methylase UbiE